MSYATRKPVYAICEQQKAQISLRMSAFVVRRLDSILHPNCRDAS